ncbi:MAG: tRNA 4-thiouridine(8) synthase ThiI [Candidatus Methanomethylophilaceae archaeon]|nr:tRNA 4-thiouridine(8) synthase ThiI [Candidatus Methanomethylophilaceae archaeon]
MSDTKVVSLVSGGIDSPVASYLMSERGAQVILLHMDNSPYSDGRSLENVKAIAERLEEYTGREFPLYSAPHGISQGIIHEKCASNYQCVMCKRLMQKTARNLAEKLGASAIVMGDSLGQVASQTLRNIKGECFDLGFPILRPLIGLDKLEIMDVAKRIGTYEISIRPAKGCTIVPSKAVTDADPAKMAEFTAAVDAESLAARIAGEAVRIR